ncbi:MAG: hypothetical protein PHO00_04320 [bacterium]|nr:hypothetical protein [bacterium]
MKKLLIIFVILNFVVVSGCSTLGSGSKKASSGYQQSGMGLTLSGSLKFDDVPVPAGFQLNVKESFAFQNNTMRVGVLLYKGKALPQDVISFYKEQMPLYNWKILNVIEYDNIQMLFEKSDETCVVTLMPGRTNIMKISVAPKSKTR